MMNWALATNCNVYKLLQIVANSVQGIEEKAG
jgi:hypothetical protein